MESKICTVCNIEKQINNFYIRYSERKECNIKRGVKRYYDNKDKISVQHKIYYGKLEINYNRNKMDIETKETQTLKNYIVHMLNYKIN